LAPEFVAEVVSPNDTSSDVEQKALAWMEAGVTIVLVVDPQTKSVRQYKSAEEIVVSTRGVIEFGQILTGFRLDVEELFIP
jgi:Uma2 family endonuclease